MKNLYSPQKITINLVHPVHAHHISQNQFLRRFGNLYSRKVGEFQLAQITFVYLARENIEGGG